MIHLLQQFYPDKIIKICMAFRHQYSVVEEQSIGLTHLDYLINMMS